MRRCPVCQRIILFSKFRGDGAVFCSAYCLTFSAMPGFCQQCAAETDRSVAGEVSVSELAGSMMFGAKDRCPRCHSIVQRKVRYILAVPVGWRARYRVIYTSRATFVARELKADPFAPLQPR
jgi:hypothetical protein